MSKKIQSYTCNTKTGFIYSEGNKVLFRVALAIIKLNEDKILAIDDPMEIFQLVQVRVLVIIFALLFLKKTHLYQY